MESISGEKLAAFDEAVVESVIHLVVSSGGKESFGPVLGIYLKLGLAS